MLQFPPGYVSVLFAARYKAVESEAASMLLVSTLALAITVPTMLWLSHWHGQSISTRSGHAVPVDWVLVAVFGTAAGSVDVIGFLALGGLFTAHIRTVGLRPDRIRCIAHDHHNFE
jgi:Co/Zn/Cd efflux system component